jgi:hypothetical protein
MIPIREVLVYLTWKMDGSSNVELNRLRTTLLLASTKFWDPKK